MQFKKKKRTTNDNIQARTEFGVTHFFRGVVYKVRGNRQEKNGDSASVTDQRGLWWWGQTGSATSGRGKWDERVGEVRASKVYATL